MSDLWGLHTGYRFDSPEHITVTRHSSEEAKGLAQEVWDQDGPQVLWGALKSTYPDEHVYVARDQSGTIHGIGRGEFETDVNDAPFDSGDSYSNYLRINHLYTSLKAPAGTGNKIMQDAAQHGVETGHHLMVNGAMPHTIDYYNQLGVNEWGGDRGQHGYWSDASQHALIAGDSIPGTLASERNDHEYYLPVPRKDRLPGSARAYGHTASTDGIRYAHLVEADVADDLVKLAARPKKIKPPWSDFHNGQAYPLQNQSTADLTHMFYSLRDAHQAGEPPADGVTPFADRIPHYEAELLDRHEAGDPEATRWADRGGYIKPDYMDDAQWHDSRRMYPEDYPVDPRPARRRTPTAAVTQDLVDRLHHEFHQWWRGTKQTPEAGADPERGPIGHWPHVENFLFHHYPVAHLGLDMGNEEAAPVMDGNTIPYLQGAEYETGPDAVSEHGYDPKEIAAAMVLLHNQSHPLRGDMAQADQDRLTDIFTKRQQMQRNYEQSRHARLAMPRRTAAPRRQDPKEMVDELRSLLLRRRINRPDTISPQRVLDAHPPLEEHEELRLRNLKTWYDDLKSRYDNMGPMTPRDMDAWRATGNGHRDPDEMTDRAKADYYTELHETGPATPRERFHFDGMQDWADQHFGNMQNDAQDAVARHHDYLSTGRHPGGSSTLEGADDAHRPGLTGAWASEISANPGHPVLRHLAEDYHAALGRVARHGPFHRDDTKPFEDQVAHQHLENAGNRLRVEMQHRNMFAVPSTDELSPILDPRERHARSMVVNPRHKQGTGGNTTAAREAYDINCQRAFLAAEGRYRGHNVEARPNYRDKDNPNSPFNDRQFRDHDIAGWFRDADAPVPKWTDAEDQYDPGEYKPAEYGRPTMRHDELPDGGYGLRLKHNPGANHWDHMVKDIESWGPGARAGVVISEPKLVGDSYTRHIFHAVVGEDGKAQFVDAQTGSKDSSHHRESVGYTLHPENQVKRLWLDKRPIEEQDKVALHNTNSSPLRYMRVDDKPLHPDAAQHVVDRGTAGDSPIKGLRKEDVV